MSARFEVHAMQRSGPSYGVGLMLKLCQEKFDFVLVNLYKGDQRSPEYLAKNRFGVVPTLIDRKDGSVHVQSASVLLYLAEALGKFDGATAAERGAAREWLFWMWDRLAPNLFRSRAIRLGFRQANFDIAHMYFTEGSSALKFLDGQLTGRDWLVGNTPTVADVGVYGVVAFASAGGFSLEGHGALQGWVERFEALPGFVPPTACLPTESMRDV